MVTVGIVTIVEDMVVVVVMVIGLIASLMLVAMIRMLLSACRNICLMKYDYHYCCNHSTCTICITCLITHLVMLI